MRSLAFSFVVLIVGAGPLVGCATLPEGRSAIDTVKVKNTGELDEQDVEDKLATAASPKLLGLFRGVFYDYEIFDASILQRDLARAERYCRGHGYLEAHARTARVIHVSDSHVQVEIIVDPGVPTLVRNVRVDGLDGLPESVVREVTEAATKALPKGDRFDEDQYAKAKTAVLLALTDDSYAYAKVEADAQADLATHTIDYVFKVKPGPASTFGAITIVNVEDTGTPGPPRPFEEGALRRALDLTPGHRYSTAEIASGTQALLDLEVLSSVQIVPTLSDPPSPVVPLTVKVEPTKMKEIRLGGGFEFDEIKTELHGLVGWEHHDFLGELRDFTIEFKPGVVLYPMRVDNIVAPQNPLPEERLRLQLKQPGFIEPRTTFFAQPEGNVFPMLVAPNPESGEPVLGYGELKMAVGGERRFGKHVLLRVSQNFQSEFPFAYTSIQLKQPTPAVILSYPQIVTTLDLRDNTIRPHVGFYASNDFTVAGGAPVRGFLVPFGGTASDIRVLTEVRGYIPISHGVTLAARSSVGLLFAYNYGDYIQHDLYPPLSPNNASNNRLYSDVDRDIETIYFRGFFSGGPSANRGYPLRGIAPHGVVPFLSPVTLSAQEGSSTGTVSCIPGQPNYDPSKCSVPIGGFTLWEASVEVRFDISGPLGAALFCDMGDVAPQQLQFRFDYLHLSCGTGARYETPVGAIRLDVGYRLPGLQVLGHPSPGDLAIDGSNAQPTFFGVPIALAFGIGETF